MPSNTGSTSQVDISYMRFLIRTFGASTCATQAKLPPQYVLHIDQLPYQISKSHDANFSQQINKAALIAQGLDDEHLSTTPERARKRFCVFVSGRLVSMDSRNPGIIFSRDKLPTRFRKLHPTLLGGRVISHRLGFLHIEQRPHWGTQFNSMHSSRCRAKAILAVVLFPQRPQGFSS